jgi:hypothetical protein
MPPIRTPRPAITFASQQLAVAVPAEEQNRVLGEFIREVLIGWARHTGVRRFDRFTSMPEVGRVSWPICHIRSILGVFTALDDIPLTHQIWKLERIQQLTARSAE